MSIIKRNFDLEDEQLVSVIDDLSLWAAPFGLKLLDLINYAPNQKVLDIGSGTGFPLIEIGNRLGTSSKVFGIDPWIGGINRIIKKIDTIQLQNVKIIEGTAEKIPFESHFFDQIISNNGINNVVNLQNSLIEINRVMKQTAIFIFNMNTEDTFKELYISIEKVLYKRGNLKDIERMKAHIYQKRKPVEEMIAILNETGFKMEKRIHDKFNLNYSNSESLFNNFFFQLGFLDGIKSIFESDNFEELINEVKIELDKQIQQQIGLRLSVPFVTFVCSKN